MAATVPPLLIAHCRAGFEAECGEDLSRVASGASRGLAITKVADSAFVTAACDALDEKRLASAIASGPPVFARSVFAGTGPHLLSSRDRVTPLTELARSFGHKFGALWLETPDTNEGKMVSGFCRRVSPLLTESLRSAGLLATDDSTAPRLHLLFATPDTVYAGTSDAETGSAWPMGYTSTAHARRSAIAVDP